MGKTEIWEDRMGKDSINLPEATTGPVYRGGGRVSAQPGACTQEH